MNTCSVSLSPNGPAHKTHCTARRGGEGVRVCEGTSDTDREAVAEQAA